VAAEAREHFKRGTTLYDEADYRGALAEFKRAYEILPNPTVLFNIGQAYYQLNEYVNALETFEKYLETKDPSGASRRALATKELDELKRRVTKVEIQTNVEGASLAVDDEPIGTSPRTLLVAIGRRRISATLAGHRPATKTVDLASGSSPPIVLELVEDKPEPPRVEATPEPPPKSAKPGPLVWGAFGVGAVGLVTGSVFGVLALNNKSSLDASCPDKQACPEGAKEHRDALVTNGTISTIGFVVAAVGAGAGLVLLLTGKGAASASSSKVGLVVGPGGGLRVAF
jgi:hypothetical protein